MVRKLGRRGNVIKSVDNYELLCIKKSRKPIKNMSWKSTGSWINLNFLFLSFTILNIPKSNAHGIVFTKRLFLEWEIEFGNIMDICVEKLELFPTKLSWRKHRICEIQVSLQKQFLNFDFVFFVVYRNHNLQLKLVNFI